MVIFKVYLWIMDNYILMGNILGQYSSIDDTIGQEVVGEKLSTGYLFPYPNFHQKVKIVVTDIFRFLSTISET